MLFFGEVQEYAAVVSEEHGLEVACVHEHFSGVEFSGLFQAVAGFGVQAGDYRSILLYLSLIHISGSWRMPEARFRDSFTRKPAKISRFVFSPICLISRMKNGEMP